MLLYKSEILLVNYLEIQYLTHIKFQEDLKILTINEIKAEFFTFFDKMIKRKGRHIYFDIRRTEHLFDNELITWFNKTILPMISSVKADKIAWLIRPETENPPIIEPQATEKIEQQIFTEPDKLMKWLLEAPERKPFSFENGKKPPNHHHH